MKPTENLQGEYTVDPSIHIHLANTKRSNHPLPSLSTPSHHIPTAQPLSAAEIALGITSPFNTRIENGTPKGMAHDSNQSLSRHSRVNNKSRSSDNSSVVEPLSDIEGCDEENTSRTSDTVLMASPGRMTPQDDSSEIAGSEVHRLIGLGFGTPSTVSTAPSTDDASLCTDYKLEDSFLPNLLQGSPGHSRSSSWGDEGLLPIATGTPSLPHLNDGPDFWSQDYRSHPLHSDLGTGHHTQSARVASFRGSGQTPEEAPRARHPWLQQHNRSDRQLHEQQVLMRRPNPHSPAGLNQLHAPPAHHFDRAPPPSGRRINNGLHTGIHGMPLHATPPRPRNIRQSHTRTPFSSHASSSPHQQSQSSQRSSSEILKTLLRKKACLYEPDTSRAVALVTWLVGRELALEFGFFSRQQLQAGVHACVANQIDSGNITRTKVNRCMQIILNSCFHYIIPRSDGSEERGDTFRALFAQNVEEDSFLLGYLPMPWGDLVVSRDVILEASLAESDEKHAPNQKGFSTPKSSPKLTSVQHSPGKESKEADDHESKRAVLLCFNENVRSAEDVFRCHSEFIRDTANAAGLQLGAQEWRSFFGHEAAGAPYLWGNVGIPLPFENKGSGAKHGDVFGHMGENEVSKFRTSWCAKRYEHDHGLCGFAHVEVNNGWLRRNPTTHPYTDTMCPMVSNVVIDTETGESIVLNECPHGRHCGYAHSLEEIDYHPNRYKTQACTSDAHKSGLCRLGDVCPRVHDADLPRQTRKSGDGRFHSPRHSKKNDSSHSTSKASQDFPSGSPIIYASPAPLSNFERHLGMPGLQNLYRRQCSVVRAHLRSGGQCHCAHSIFGDDRGITDAPDQATARQQGLPKPTPRS